jgi:hypothetical protein
LPVIAECGGQLPVGLDLLRLVASVSSRRALASGLSTLERFDSMEGIEVNLGSPTRKMAIPCL